jgi:dTMP kinase
VGGPGRFVVFEGGEGTGKTTQARYLAQTLREEGIAVVLTREPGGAPGAEVLRRLLLEHSPSHDWSSLSEALLHYAARCEHLDKTIRPALAGGRWVISDRFADSTAAYQGAGLALAPGAIKSLRALVVGTTEPDLTLVLDVPVDQALHRTAKRSPRPADRYESMDLEFHDRVRAAFLDYARRAPHRYVVIDAAAPADVVARAIRQAVFRHLHVGSSA